MAKVKADQAIENPIGDDETPAVEIVEVEKPSIDVNDPEVKAAIQAAVRAQIAAQAPAPVISEPSREGVTIADRPGVVQHTTPSGVRLTVKTF